MDEILNVAFIIAATSFFKTQFGWSGRTALIGAFVIALVVGFAPTIGEQLPGLSPYITVLVKVIALFIAAAGSWDAIKQIHNARTLTSGRE